MAGNIKRGLKDAGEKIAESTKEAGAAAKSGAGKAADWVKDKSGEAGEKASSAVKSTGEAVKKVGKKIKGQA